MRLAVALLALASTSAFAVEGMWPPQQLPEIESALKQTGLKLDPAQLADLTAHPMNAIVSLGGCTASFVSPQGLVVTNHHCAYGAIQLNSSPEKNYLQDGFNAASLADEVTAGPSARIFVTDGDPRRHVFFLCVFVGSLLISSPPRFTEKVGQSPL